MHVLTSSILQFVYVFCGTNFNSAFKDYVPEQVVFKGFREGVVQKLLEMQEEKIQTNLRLFDRFSEYEDPEALQNIPNPYIHCVFDDTVADPRCHSADCLNEIAMYGRHYRCCTWINTQHGIHSHSLFLSHSSRLYCQYALASMCIFCRSVRHSSALFWSAKQSQHISLFPLSTCLIFFVLHSGHALNPGFRANADVAVTFEQMQKNQKETVREEWFNFFSKKGIFDSWLGMHTKDRNFVAYHAAAISLPLEDRLFKGQGDPEAPRVKLGCPEYWAMYSNNSSGGTGGGGTKGPSSRGAQVSATGPPDRHQ